MKNLFIKLQPFLLIGCLLYGAMGGQNYNFIIVTLACIIISFIILAVTKKSVFYPPGFYLYIAFLIFFALNLYWTSLFWNTFWYLLLFVCGFLFWILAYNLKKEFKHFYLIIIFLGIILGIFALYYRFFDPQVVDSFSLHKMATNDHHNIGDLWSVIIVILAVNLLKSRKNKLIWLTLLLFGGYILFISKSRAAIISLVAGLYFIFDNFHSLKKYFKTFLILIFISLTFFLFFARTKPTLLNRGYYLQGLSGISRNPLGIGVGNFGQFSGDPKNHLLGYSDYSSVGMNLLLEIFAGMGVFATIFLIWFVKVNFSVFSNPIATENLYRVIFLVLTVNFMIHFVYLIPTMLWIWFISLGLSQE